MNVHRRQFLQRAAAAASLFAVPHVAFAQSYPTKPVHLIVGFPAGGPADIGARVTAEWLSQRLGQQVIVENRPGAATNIATEAMIRAPADGYTLLFSMVSNAINATLYDKMNFNFIRDTAPVGTLMRTPGVMLVNPAMPATIPDFIAYAKANPGKINMSSAGPGTVPHIYGELFKIMTGTDMVMVHYRGAGPAMPDLISGRIQVMFDSVPSAIQQVRSGKLRPLGVTTATRLDVMPDVPAINEFVPGYVASNWYGIVAPKDTPAEIVARLNKEINAILADPAVRARIADLGASPFAGSAADFAKFIAEDTERWGKVIREANIKPE
ncbi:Bug family tripartite tricarboxylate transporter substrate binding protein [Rhodoplanes sp. Z2-YC6860]|uniref:Bug family tripartite tricarboxylate transporter substrate binding protein n=1 Tax=Rhodoplanes sp. Z2-YC6860 TaxID=674703 RepID=UPI00078BB4DB|nr:tripartite tricarboxylate transporter substrate binding protein [Rhodoplanes sp. Z2-YC6860]AMN40300.1 ABC transporter substrate-binding protein [Rhodoplanes sp. Z2-YC6860]